MIDLPHWIEAGSGPPIVLLHGISGGAEGWRPLLGPLAAAGRRAIAWDLPGYGRSPAPRASGFGSWVNALLSLFDATHLERPVLVGHSLGGMIALETALAAPGRLGGLFLVCTTPGFGVSAGPAQQAFLETRLGPLAHGATMAELASSVIPEMMAAGAAPDVLAAHQALMGAIPPDSYRAAMTALVGFDRRHALDRIDLPVTCLAGEHDRIARPAVMRAMASRLPMGRYGVLSGAGHLAPYEQPDRFVEALLAS